MTEAELTEILTIEERRKIAARVFRDACQRVAHDLVQNAMIAEARAVLPAIVPDVVKDEVKKLTEHRWGGSSLIASAMTAEFSKSVNEYLASITVRFEPKQ